MQIRHIFSELGTGLRRNISMTISLIVTMFVSLTLVGFAVMLNSQTDRTEEYWGDRLQIQVLLCAEKTNTGPCVNGEVTDAERDAVEEALNENPDVESIEYRSQREAYDRAKELYSQDDAYRAAFEVTEVQNFSASYFVTLKDPDEYLGVESQVTQMPGVARTENLIDYLKPLYVLLDYLRWFSIITAGFLVIAAILQVSNTIRLTAYARRREIGIMRLVGASTWHIQLPFLLESLLAALIAGLLACLALAALVQFFIKGVILDSSMAIVTKWIGWEEAVTASVLTVAFAVLLGLIPTLVMTRKYLNV
jgi:cell division transport system permease protein